MLEGLRVGDIELRSDQAAVAEASKLHVGLLGMSFLGAFTSFEMRGHELVLTQ